VRRPGANQETAMALQDSTPGLGATATVDSPLPLAIGQAQEQAEQVFLEAEQFALMRRGLISRQAITLLAVALLMAVMRNSMPAWILWIWALCHGGNALFDIWIFRRCDPQAGNRAQAASCLQLFVLNRLASGCLWGLAGILFIFPAYRQEELFVILVLVLVGTSAVADLSVYLPAFYAMILPILGMMAVRMLTAGTLVHWVIAISLFGGWGVLLPLARHLNQVIRDSLALRFKSEALLQAVTRQKELAETARARAEEAREAAERANLSKSRFLAAASHDLRQPLHALGLFVAALQSNIATPEGKRLVDNIQASVTAMEGLFNSLLDISRLDAGVITPHLRDVPIAPLLERIALDYRPAADGKEVAFRVRPCEAAVHTDPVLLERMLRNLVSNAIRYTQRGGVLVGCRRRGTTVWFEVWDTGQGIPEDKQDEIFQEFVQLHNPERDRNKGLGLGLAIVRRLATLLGYPIELHSRPGRGSMFRLAVPAGQMPKRKTRSLVDAVSGDLLAGACMLVIDDDPAVLQGMQELLATWGCKAICAESGQEAARHLEAAECTPELVISDYRLRDGETGAEVIQQVQQALGEMVPGILITGDTAPDRLREARDSGYMLLHKPVAPAKLRAALQSLLLGSQAP
jgi:two-component system, sensor histidine kinase